MLVLAGLADPGKVCRTVIARGGAEGFSTFYGYYMLEALAEGGLYDEALQIISNYWGAMLDLGATTFWEDLNYAHAAGAARISHFLSRFRPGNSTSMPSRAPIATRGCATAFATAGHRAPLPGFRGTCWASCRSNRAASPWRCAPTWDT